eukprot:Phypoly_transcript_01004.p1 GENE.Phypoly_transcript_01004~~Phypoly_transcript_01004.p1  ORF type:complete len:1224 (-),score=188.92 Phypoly_transcript_01004:75-3746(-)
MNGVKAIGDAVFVHQGILEDVVRSLFKGYNVQKNVRKEGLVRNPTTGSFLEIDVWVPDLRICFEFQDVYHYTSTWDNQRTMEDIMRNDQMKREEISRRGHTLIAVPCWWDSSEESLAATVRFHRPDIVLPAKKGRRVPPISLNSHEEFFDIGSVPDVGELMLASFPQSLQFKATISPKKAWWMGEKYDGIRACWNPKRKTLYSRAGNELEIPLNFELHFPSIFLDSEIWFGRGYFPDSQKLTSTTFIFINWADLRFIVFDEASRSMNHWPFERRYAHMVNSIDREHLFLIPAMRVLGTRKHQVNFLSQEIIADGGEGVILRQPKSVYEHGRSEYLLKLKTSREDKEALVVEVKDGGSTYDLMLPDGQIFTATNQEFKPGATVPIRGDIVTFTYDSFSRRALPINPKIFRKRSDVTWEEVVMNHEKDAKSNGSQQVVMGYTHKPVGYWLSQQGNNVRVFFEEFAKANNFDPLIPANWYQTPRQAITETKKASSMLEHFKGGYVKALEYAFPDIGLEPGGFDIMSRRHWQSAANRRKFFVEYAREHSFDPLIAQNWYDISRDDIMNVKSAGSVMLYYSGSTISALLHLFPEIGLERTKFPLMPRNHWVDLDNRRKVFDKLAEEKGFDPLVAENWYEIVPQILNSKEANTLLIYYGGNYIKALQHVYPDIGIDPSRFHYLPLHHWVEVKNRRKFFISYAHQQGFDPFDPKGWYDNASTEAIQSSKWGKIVLSYYKGNLAYALKQLFPEISFDMTKLPIVPKNYWSDPENRRAFFVRIAKENEFDHLSLKDWYQLGRDNVLKKKGASAVLSYYGGSYIAALLDLFPSLGSDKHKYSFITRSYWKYVSNRRKFFTDIAAQQGFDALRASNWYNLKSDVILQAKGVHSVLAYHRGSYIKALKVLFPEIGIDERRFGTVPRNYWTVAANRRKFFENIALSLNLDPLVPEHWYSIPTESILNTKGVSSILFHHKGSLHKALSQLFPEVALDKSKLSALSKNYWENPENRRRFFFKFAKDNCFDPKVPENWYYLSKAVFSSNQGASAVLEFYGGNIAKGLKEVFPDIEWNESNFLSLHKSNLDDLGVRRKFFGKFAATLGFDPLVPENWYKASFDSLLTIKGASSYLLHYHGSIVKALMEAFPEIGLNESKFAIVTRKYWKDVNNRKLFFTDLAKEKNFDPNSAHNWYSVSLAQFLTTKGASSIIACYGSFQKALISLFPNIQFEKKKFSFL